MRWYCHHIIGVTESLIREYHLQNSHAGVQIFLLILRENYWTTRGRKTIRSAIRRWYKAKKFLTSPASLPVNRVRDVTVFEVVGVDLAGPLYPEAKKGLDVVAYLFCIPYRSPETTTKFVYRKFSVRV